MSGHSKWATTKNKKAAIDAKRGKLFAKLIKDIEVAAKQGGPDPAGNAALYEAVYKAKKSSMPADNIRRAIKRGSGAEGEGVNYENITYEGYAPGGVGLIAQQASNEHLSARQIRDSIDFRRARHLTLDDAALDLALFDLLDEVLQHARRGNRILVAESECVRAVQHIVDRSVDARFFAGTLDAMILQNDILNVLVAHFISEIGHFRNGQTTIVKQDDGLRVFDLLRDFRDFRCFGLDNLCVCHGFTSYRFGSVPETRFRQKSPPAARREDTKTKLYCFRSHLGRIYVLAHHRLSLATNFTVV